MGARLMLAGCWLVGAIAALAAALPACPAFAESRVALVVGNGAYRHTAALANPGNDARDMAAALRATGFDVTEAFDADKRTLERALRDFTDKLARADVALLFYAGHGLQLGQENWLVPVDAKLERERDLAFEAVKLDFVLQQMEIDRQGKTTIVLLDACRDNPLAKNLARSMGTRSTAVGRGLAAASTGLGTFIAYATQPGNVALDGEGLRNSPFTSALLTHMQVAGRNLPATMIEVRKEVVAATGGRQVPWDHSALTGDFYFVRTAAGAGGTPPATGAAAPKGGADVAALEARHRQLEADARKREEEARKAAAAEPASKAAQDFTIHADNWLVGRRILDAEARDLAACRRLCTEDSRCIGFDWFTTEKSGICRHYESVERRDAKPGWRSGLRPDWAAKVGAAAAPQGTRGPSFVVRLEQRIVGEQIPAPPSTANCESRCRTETGCAAWSLSRQGECELFSRVDRLGEDRQWRSGIRADVWARMVAGAAQPGIAPRIVPADPGTGPTGIPPRIEPAAPAAATGPATVPPVEPLPGKGGSASGLTLDDNVRLEGNPIGRPARAASADACRRRCAETAGCVGFMHGRRAPDMGQCHLFDRIDRRQEDRAWRSGVRREASNRLHGPASGAVASTGDDATTLSLDTLLVSDTHNRVEHGFLVYERHVPIGDEIKAADAATSAACVVVCRNTPGCVAAAFHSELRGTGRACVAFRAVSEVAASAVEIATLLRPRAR